MTLMDPETLAKVVEQAGGWPKLLAEWQKLVELSYSRRAMFAEKRGPGTQEYNDNIYLRGFNGGLLHSIEMFHKAASLPPPAPPRLKSEPVTYRGEFGPHRRTLITEEGEWSYSTEEDVHV